jgi:hypothetical protein
MTDDEAEAMLKELSKHYRMPVLPVRRFCDALRTWGRAVQDGKYREKDLVPAIDLVFLAIEKSNLLWRLLWAGEPLRSTPCPVHEGKWSGCVWPKDSKDVCPCMSGCNVTGWLPEQIATVVDRP